MNTRLRTARVVMVCALVVFAHAAFAQQPAGTIAGTVTDQSGAVVVGARVTIVQAATQRTVRRTTSARGTFTASDLPPGRYEVRVQAAGFKQTTVAFDVLVGRVTDVPVPLELGKVNETVTVKANAIRVNPFQVALDGVVTEDLIRRLPQNGRNFLDLGQLEPGVQAARDDIISRGAFARLSLNGQTGLSTRVAVDGLDINDEFSGSVALNLSLEAVKEFQVSRALFDVLTGLTGIGAVNVATRAGGNDWHGDAFVFRRANRVAAFGGQPATPFNRTQAGASAGGRLVRDRLFAFGSYEGNSQDGTVVTTIASASQFPQFSGVWLSPFDEHMSTSRLDWNVTHAVRAFVRATSDWNEGVSSRTLGATKLAPLLTSNRAYQVAVGVDAVAGRFVHSVRVGHTSNRLASDLGLDRIPGMPRTVDPAGRLLTVLEAGAALTGIQIGTHPNAPQRRMQDTAEIRYDGSLGRGAHALRWGADLNLIRTFWFETVHGYAPQVNLDFTVSTCGTDILCYPVKNVEFGSGLGYFTEPPSHGYPHGGASNNRVHLYAGDTWRMPRQVTVTLGVRWVYEPGAADPGLARPAILDEFRAGLAGADRRDINNVAPQVGVAWSPSSSGRWVVRAGAGVFYDANRLQNVMFGERTTLLPMGIGSSTQGTVVLHPEGHVIFDLQGGNYAPPYGPALITPGVNWMSKPLGTPGLLDALFRAHDAYRAASLVAAANFPSGPTQCELKRTCRVLAPDYRTPSSRHYTVGLQRELGAGLVLSADYVRIDSVHFMMRHNINRTGAADTLDPTRALDAMNKVQRPLGCADGAAGVDCALAKNATLAQYVNNGLGWSATAASMSGLSNAAFPGINPDFNNVVLLEMNGSSTYNALQVNLRGALPDVGRAIRRPSVVVSYALGRLAGTAEDQSVLNIGDRIDNDNAAGFRGPTSLDRTHVLSVAADATLPRGVRISLLSKAFSALPQTLFVPQQSSVPGAEIFMTDFNGDGTSQDVLPGTNRGSYGRSIGCGAAALNRLIESYNASQAGHPTAAGRALMSAGLFSETQLQSLGAVSKPISRAPDGQVCLDAFYTTDVRLARPFTLRGGRLTIEPALEVFNVFNVANYDLPDNKLSGSLNGKVGSLNGTTGANRPNRADATGSFTPGAPRSWQLVLRVSF